jgi:hypothetical protein
MSVRPDSDALYETFTGRAAELQDLHNALKRRSDSPVYVIGPPGAGKTAFVTMYAQRYASDYIAVVSISAVHLADVTSIPALIAARLGSAIGERVLRTRHVSKLDNTAIAFEELLRDIPPDRPILLIIDEFDALRREQQDQLSVYARLWSERIRFVLLGYGDAQSRVHDKRARTISLSPFRLEELVELLRRRLAYAEHDGKSADEILRALLQQPIDASRLTPRFLIRFAREFIERGEVASALSNTLLAEFRETTALVISPDAKNARVVPTASLGTSEIVTPSNRIFTATPLIVVPSYSLFWRQKLDELERLISAKNVRESELQVFFEENEVLLRGIDYERVIPHPVLARDDDGDLIPDFFLKPHNTDLVDVLDLKLPAKKLIVGPDDRKHVSAALAEAIAQVREYRAYFENPKYQRRVREEYGVTGCRPRTVVVMGRSGDEITTPASRRVLDELPPHVRLVTYDDLLARMRACVWSSSS